MKDSKMVRAKYDLHMDDLAKRMVADVDGESMHSVMTAAIAIASFGLVESYPNLAERAKALDRLVMFMKEVTLKDT